VPQPLLDVLLVALGYVSGSLPMGVIVARLTNAPDPRTVGSGRTGGTNALRAMGVRRGLAVGLLDIAKGTAPVATALIVGASPVGVALTGTAAVLGAWRSMFLRFHGGRGVATGIGALLVIQPLVVVLGAPFFFGVIGLTRYVSLGSLLGAAAAVAILAGFVWLELGDPADLLFGVLAGGIVWIAHSDNIRRLLRGEERRFDFRARDDRSRAEADDGEPGEPGEPGELG
jgi:acyl phosphate:glycerol-3-phosphate acyltransferase